MTESRATRRIYLDNAATSWPKPESVYEAIDRYQRQLGAPAGRAVYREGEQTQREIDQARQLLAQLFGVGDPRRIIFTLNGTDSLNLAIHGLVRPGDHVVTSVCEHNSVLRPLRWCEENCNVQVTRIGCDGRGYIDPGEVRAALRKDTRLVALTHASNVTGCLQPIEEIGRMLEDHPALFLIDAAQTAGHLPVRVDSLRADLVAAPGHKGLLGPLGTGVLYVGPAAENSIRPLRQGGTGTQSQHDRQPDALPDKLESGNHNVLGIFGLAAGVRYVSEHGAGANPEPGVFEPATAKDTVTDSKLAGLTIAEHGRRLTEKLLAGLGQIARLRVHGPDTIDRRVPVVSFSVNGYDPREIAVTLDATYGVQVRAGFHCAPLMHRALGTAATGGTVRLSPGPLTTERDIDDALEAIEQIATATMLR